MIPPMKTLTILLLLGFSFGVKRDLKTDNSMPAWLDFNGSSIGVLCEDGNDEIGKKLGCSCRYPYNKPATDLIADCQGQTLGTENTQLPPRINVSSHVRTINFYRNQILRLDSNTFGNVDGVYELNFGRNLIHKVNNLSFPRLSKLDLSHNLITNLTNDAFKNCDKLQYLDLSYNHLTFIEAEVFSVLSFLKVLNLESNHIGMAVEYYAEYPFLLTDLEWLVELNLNNNSLEEFPNWVLTGTKNLKKLHLQNNYLFSLPRLESFPDHLKGLEELDLSGNRFNIFTANEFAGFQSMRKLVVDRNRELTMIEAHALADMPELFELSCQKNHQLTYIDPLAFRSDPKILNSNSTTPKVVRLADNSLAYFDYPLLDWKTLEQLDLIRNPWVCDCNLQWIPSFHANNPQDAAILTDSDFVCHGPTPLRGIIVVNADPDEMLCFSEATTIAGLIAIIIFGVVLVVLCTFATLAVLGVLPERFKRFNLFGTVRDDFPKYRRVNPKPQNTRRRDEKYGDPETASELEWDSTDIGGR